MSENHYSHIPPPIYSHLGTDTNKQKNDYSGLPTSANQQWSVGPSHEFGNREEYMETQLTEENYNNCGLDSNANQNDVLDDEPYPPPGLRRLVTGQTVSFDDGPSSPPFDRIVPGEGNSFNNYPQSTRMSKPAADPYPDNVAISERYVSGSTTKDYSSLPRPTYIAQPTKKDVTNPYNNSMFAGAQSTKKDNINTIGNNNYYNVDNPFNLSTQDFFDTYLHDGSTPMPDENTSKSIQYAKKYPNMPSGFQNIEANKRDNYFQPEKPINASKPPQNNFNDDFNGENKTSPFPVNFQSRANHLQQDGKVLKSLENSQYSNVEKSLDAYPSNRRASVENFIHEQPPLAASYDNTSNQKINSQNYDPSFQIYEPNPVEENDAHFNQTEQLAAKGNQESFSNQEDGFGNRDVMKKDPVHHDGSLLDPRKLGNVTMDGSLIKDGNKESNLKSPYRKSSTIGSEERIDHEGVSLERGKVPGAQSTPNENQPIRQFQNASNSSYNTSNIFKTIEDEDEREENVQGTDSDEKSLGRRMVLGYNSNTIPGPRSSSRKMPLDSKVNKQYQFDSSFNKGNRIEPLEHRMVVGEGGNIPSKNKTSSASRNNRDRKKQLYDRVEHHNVDSDDEDYEEFDDRTYDNSPDRESRSYHDKYYHVSPPHRNDKRSYRRNRDSFTQSQDESYFDDDDDDYDTSTFRNQRRYYGRRYNREPVYKHYEHDPRYRDERYRDRRDYYTNRYEEDSYYGRNSRPSSRSGSEYRRDFIDYANPRYYNRPPYYEHLDHRYIVNYGAEPRLSKKEIDYWSKIREIEPQKYMNWFKVTFVQEYKDWYLKYVNTKMVQPANTYQADRRGSGHSGQSSVNNDISVNDEKLLDISREPSLFKPVESEMNRTQEIRCTPMKFSIPHVKGKFSSLNQLLMINPCSPRDGQRADIDFGRILPLEQDVDYIELLKFSGPCVIGETHVNTVSNYLRDLTNNASHPSEKLLYQLIDLIIKLRGVTDGIAISELLTDNYHKSQTANVMIPKEELKLANNHPSLSETELIEKFYHLYFQGNRNEALDLALNNQMWGQALIAGFTMGPKYHSRVLTEFFSIPINSPLKTAYQFYSKQIPQVAMSCSEEKWSDWRIHLAVMLSYPTSDPEFNKQAIITLGDSLSHKDIFASHFCYLAAQADFGPPTKSSTKYTLLTLRNGPDNFDNYPSTRAVLLTQIYEFAKRLQKKEFVVNSLLPYKLLLAVRLISYRNFSVALQYLESIALDVIENPNNYEENQINDVIELSEKVKYADAKFLNADSIDEKQWLIDLRQIAKFNYNEGVVHAPQSNDQPPHLDTHPQYPDQSFSHQPHSLGQPSYNQPQSFPSNEIQQPKFFNPSLSMNQPMSLPPSFPQGNQQPPERRPSQPWESDFNSQEQMNSTLGYSLQDPYKNVTSNNNEYLESNENNTQMNSRFDQSDVPDNEQGYWDTPQQTIIMPSKSKFTYFNSEEDKKSLTQDTSHNHKDNNQPSQPMHKNADKNSRKENKNENNNGGGWLGGIFGKLSLRPKNEMKLPDDKNPSIVWNEEKKRWVNVNGEDEDDVAKITPPPRASEIQNFQPQITQNQLPRSNEAPLLTNSAPDPNKPPMQSSTNMYKLSRGKGMKANYVNVLSQSTTPSTNVPPPGPVMDSYSKPQMLPNMKLFTPTSDGVPNNMAGDPSLNPRLSENSQIRNPNPEMPMFYNPAQYNS